jgi:Cd2+/Zn2+-exporting ATPase
MKTPNVRAHTFKIRGMDCAEEVAVLKREVGPLVGGADRLAFDLVGGRMVVTGEEAAPEAIMAAVARTGMAATPWRRDVGASTRDARARLRTLLTVLSGAALAAGIVVSIAARGWTETLGHDATGVPLPPAARVAFLVAVAAGFWLVAPRAGLALRRLRPDMNLLMTLAVAGALVIGEWFEAAVVSFLFAVSLELESWSLGRARKAVEALLDLAPASARRVGASGVEEIVVPEAVLPGERVVVRPGERIPVDGVVVAGASDVNQASITGESVPVFRSAGHEVFAGTINGDGALTVECRRPLHETTLHHVIRMVEEAQTRRAPSERWVDRFAAVYTPVILLLAFLVAVVPPLAFGAVWSDWVYRGLVLLVIGCPCALVISTPVSVVAALAAAASRGVLIKGGAALEAPARLKAMAFDKTGTLTEGRLELAEIVPLDGHTEVELLERAAALEASSNHPVARAIVQGAAARGVAIVTGGRHEVIPGKGAHGTFDGRDYWLGSHRYLEERGQETPEVHDRLEALSADGHTVVVIGNDRHVCGFLTARDVVRPAARAALAELRSLGVAPLVLLTGDNPGTARAIADAAGVDDVRADLAPADKVRAVEDLVLEHGAVAMVGDGVNDAPALARSSLGIAMGAAGSDAAIETADVALLSDDLSRLPWLVRHSRRALSVIRANVVLALGIKAGFLLLALTGQASLWAAIAADMGASLLVIANGLTLLRTDA